MRHPSLPMVTPSTLNHHLTIHSPMNNAPQWHYTNKTGQQAGPIPTEELIELISNKTIPTTSMAWKEGMPAWKPVNQIEDLEAALSKATMPAQVSSAPPASPGQSLQTSSDQSSVPEPSINPYEAPTIPSPEEYYSYETASYGGIGRLAYFLISIMASIAIVGGKFAMGVSDFAKDSPAVQDAPPIVLGLGILSIFISFYLMFARFKNIGMSRWWTLGLIVPILNIFVSIWLVSRQEGWIETQRLDTAGKVIAWLCWGLIILTIIAVVAIAVFAFQTTSPPQTSMLF
jgi:hypothetical protein